MATEMAPAITATVPPESAGTTRALKLAAFEGPLDVLLHFIEKDNLDITTISLVQVTDQYLALLRAEEEMNAAALAEFIFIGSKLLYLKSRALLPRPEAAADEADQDEIAIDLTEALREYRQYKEAARLFREREQQGLRAYPRQAPAPALPPGSGLDSVTLDMLTRLFQEALSRKDREPPLPIRVLQNDHIRLRDKIDALRRALRRRDRVSFRALIEECRSRVEVIVQFMAVLELIKAAEVVARQDALFSDIELLTPKLAAVESPAPASDASDEATA
ncbi:MAG: segregation/condensation protein A [Dehalococcoidia bacterium]|nr:segregation/condensation protein A [Dehalococcoidia bacterium]